MSMAEVREKRKDDEWAALREYGVHLADDHLEGYFYKPDTSGDDRRGIMKPWESSMIKQLGGPLQPRLSKTVEEWKNEEVLFEVREGIAYITLNRPAANNAMNDGIEGGIRDAVCILKNRPDIRIAVLTANGRMFCAGGDPKGFQQAQASAGAIGAGGEGADGEKFPPPPGPMIAHAAEYAKFNDQSAQEFAKMLYEFSILPQFTICCMNGSAMGGGVGLVSICDYVIAVKTAHATLSEVKLGVIPATISPHVIRTIGTANSKRLFCTAENCNAEMAREAGLVQKVVPTVADFPAAIKEIADKLVQCAPGAVFASKMVMMNCLNQTITEEMIQYTAKEYTRVRRTEGCVEGMKALLAKKKPSWMEQKIAIKE